MFYFIQSIPQNNTPLVAPQLEKLQLKTLKAHLPRYTKSGLSAIEIQWWKAAIESLEDTAKVVRLDDGWMWCKLLQLKELVSEAKSRTPGLAVQEAHAPSTSDSLIASLLESERGEIPEVSVGFAFL